MREGEIERIKQNEEMDETEKNQVLRAQRMKSIADVLEDVEALINTHFFDEFSKAKSSLFLKRITENQKLIDMRLFKRTWRTLNCSPKTMKIIREIQENLLCVGRRKELMTKKGGNTVLVQQVGDDSEREAHCELLQESG